MNAIIFCSSDFVSGSSKCEEQNGRCEQICVEVEGPEVTCRCFPGFGLQEDGRSCKGRAAAGHRAISFSH